jgi:hypothetical protein
MNGKDDIWRSNNRKEENGNFHSVFDNEKKKGSSHHKLNAIEMLQDLRYGNKISPPLEPFFFR